MPLRRSTTLSLAFAAAALPLLLPAGSAQAQSNRGGASRTLFTWSGTVDREVVLAMQGNRLSVRGERGILASRTEQRRTSNALPRTDGEVFVRLLDGRGDVDVIQQPNARNDFTTLIRIRDPRGGADRYRITTYWTPDARSRRDDGRYGNDDWRCDEDGPWNRGRANGNGNGNGKAKGKAKQQERCDDDRDDRDRDDRDRRRAPRRTRRRLGLPGSTGPGRCE